MKLSPAFERALVYAARIHSNQERKISGVPYIAHLLAVAALALEYSADEETAIGALLHDAAEDAGGQARLADIRQEFGEGVAQLVADCTDTYDTPKPAWRPRKEAYIAHLPHASPGAQLISCCDKLHNARTIVADLRTHGARVWQGFKGGRDGTLWYYQTLWTVFTKTQIPASLVDELRRTIDAMESLTTAE